MKIGILTFHRAENFGASLQVYALSEFLKSIGHTPIVIDYRCPAIEHQYDIYHPYLFLSSKNILKTIPRYVKRVKQAKFRHAKKKLFHEFIITNLNLTCPYKRITHDLGFDAYITGSDQVWRLTITGGIDKHYFLNFPMRQNAIKISYAASSETSDFPNLRKNKEQISKYLNSLNAVSVRELTLKEELCQYVDKDIHTCVDPTFLISAESYNKIAILPHMNNYILVYHLFYSEESYNIAKTIRMKTGKQIVEVFAGGIIKFNSDHIQIDTFGPSELLGLIVNSDTIITTSFHGLALSIILKKNVWVVNKGSNARLINLLKSLDLTHRVINDSSMFVENTYIDYDIVYKTLKQHIECSKRFLIDSLK